MYVVIENVPFKKVKSTIIDVQVIYLCPMKTTENKLYSCAKLKCKSYAPSKWNQQVYEYCE